MNRNAKEFIFVVNVELLLFNHSILGRIYSSSVLLVYDARRLREVLAEANKRKSPLPPTLNGNSMQATGGVTAANWNDGFKLNRSISSASSTSSQSSLNSPAASPGVNNGSGGEPIQSFKKIQRNHSVNNNYDQVGFGLVCLWNLI